MIDGNYTSENHVLLETRRLRLRRFRHEDEDCCFEFLSDERCCDLDGGYQNFESRDDEFNIIMERFAKQESRLMIALKDSDRAVGTINIISVEDRAVETVELGFVISPLYQYQGYAYEAVSALIGYLTNELHVGLILAGAFEHNLPSRKLIEKLGFKPEGIRRKALDHYKLGPTDLFYYYFEG